MRPAALPPAALVLIAALAAACGTPPAPAPPSPSAAAPQQTTLADDIREARRTAARLADQAYQAELPLWRRVMGAPKPSQSAKRENVYNTHFEKELRKIAHKRGMTFEDVQAAAAHTADSR